MKSCNMKKSVEVIKGSNGKQMLMDITFPEKSNNEVIVKTLTKSSYFLQKTHFEVNDGCK